MPVRYIRLEERDLENVTNAASLLLKLQAVGLHTYLLND
jgi:hypothetical protein